jgi:FkbM family methyltransferase
MEANVLRYVDLLGEEQTKKLLAFFSEIESGRYEKNDIIELHLKDIRHPVFIRCIRADMQAFTHTFIKPYIEKKPYLSQPEYIIDAGTNIGLTTVLFANLWEGCKIIGLEADKDNYDFALKNTQIYSNITVLNKGLWNKEATLKIEAGQEDGFVVREIHLSGENSSVKDLVDGISIDSLMKMFNIHSLDFVKINIEGSEKEVFSENYETWLPKTKSLLVELHDGKNQGCSFSVFSAINKYNFSVAETERYGILFVQEPLFREWYKQWYREEIYLPNINKDRFPTLYLDNE